jgi:hypothetical protein
MYDIALSLLSCSEMSQFGLEYPWRTCLQQLLVFLSSLPSAQARLVPNLQAKLSLAFNKTNTMYMPPHSPPSHHSSPITMQQTFMTYPPQGLQALPQAMSYGHHHQHQHQHQINGTGQATMYPPVNIPAVSGSEHHHPGSQASRMDYYYHGMNEQ